MTCKGELFRHNDRAENLVKVAVAAKEKRKHLATGKKNQKTPVDQAN
jgi:hypothetical protein